MLRDIGSHADEDTLVSTVGITMHLDGAADALVDQAFAEDVAGGSEPAVSREVAAERRVADVRDEERLARRARIAPDDVVQRTCGVLDRADRIEFRRVRI